MSVGCNGVGVAVKASVGVAVGGVVVGVGVTLAPAAARGTMVGVGAARLTLRSQPVADRAVSKSIMTTKEVFLFISIHLSLVAPAHGAHEITRSLTNS